MLLVHIDLHDLVAELGGQREGGGLLGGGVAFLLAQRLLDLGEVVVVVVMITMVLILTLP